MQYLHDLHGADAKRSPRVAGAGTGGAACAVVGVSVLIVCFISATMTRDAGKWRSPGTTSAEPNVVVAEPNVVIAEIARYAAMRDSGRPAPNSLVSCDSRYYHWRRNCPLSPAFAVDRERHHIRVGSRPRCPIMTRTQAERLHRLPCVQCAGIALPDDL